MNSIHIIVLKGIRIIMHMMPTTNIVMHRMDIMTILADGCAYSKYIHAYYAYYSANAA